MIRSGASFLCWVVAVVAAIITVPTLWIATHVADEDGYVDFTRPFVADAEFRDAIVATITDDLFSQGGLPASAKPVVERALRVRGHPRREAARLRRGLGGVAAPHAPAHVRA